MFLLIWGFRVRRTAIEHGHFFCPGCGGDRNFTRLRLRRWFTFFWIPLVPTKVLGEVIECDVCHRGYNDQVLLAPTSSALAQWTQNAARVLAAAVVQMGDADDPVLRAAAVASVQRAGVAYDEPTLLADIPQVSVDQVASYVMPLADGLSTTGRETFLADLVRIAGSAPPITPAQGSLFHIVGRSLGLTDAHVAGIVATAMSTPPPDGGPASDVQALGSFDLGRPDDRPPPPSA